MTHAQHTLATAAMQPLYEAAPDLLKALEVISMWTRCQCRDLHGDNLNCPVLIAEQAINKARGL